MGEYTKQLRRAFEMARRRREDEGTEVRILYPGGPFQDRCGLCGKERVEWIRFIPLKYGPGRGKPMKLAVVAALCDQCDQLKPRTIMGKMEAADVGH